MVGFNRTPNKPSYANKESLKDWKNGVSFVGWHCDKRNKIIRCAGNSKTVDRQKKLSTAHRLHGEISAIFAYAIVHNFTDYDPAQPVIRQIPAQKIKHRAAIIDPNLVGQLLRDIGNYRGTFVVKSAFMFSPLVFQRPGEIRQLLREDIDLESREWRPYISKTDFDNIVPLSTQAIAILEEIKPLTGWR